MEKVIRYLFSAIFAIFGGLIGYSFSDYIEIKQMLENLPSGVHQATTVATIVVGVLVGIALAPLVAWIVMKGIDLLARALQKFPVQEVHLLHSQGVEPVGDVSPLRAFLQAYQPSGQISLAEPVRIR